MPIPSLPQDIWYLVVQYLTDSQYKKLLYMNRALLNVVLDERYRSVEWLNLNESIAGYLDRLQDPYIAARVRSLRIQHNFILSFRVGSHTKDLFQKAALLNPPRPPRPPVSDFKKKFASFLHQTPPQPVATELEHIAVTDGPKPLSSLNECLHAITKSMDLMVNLTVLKLEWGGHAICVATQRFITLPGRASGNLYKLVLYASVTQLELILAIREFTTLGEVDFKFYEHSDGERDELIMVNSIAPFINRLASSLTSLTISSYAKGDHTPFLAALGPFPKLSSLALFISFTKDHLSNPSPITRLLDYHRSGLTSVQIHPHFPYRILQRFPPDNKRKPFYPPIDSHTIWAATTIMKQWIIKMEWISHIKYLAIPVFDRASTLALLHRTGDALRNLSFLGHFMSQSDVEEVIATLGTRPNLRTLSIGVIQLTLELFVCLANAFPNLYSLTLVYSVVNPSFLSDEFRILEYFPKPLDWALEDVSIFFQQHRDDSVEVFPETRDEERLMQKIQVFVLPMVRSFRGRGHTRPKYE